MAKSISAILREIDQIEKSKVLTDEEKNYFVGEAKKEIAELRAQAKLSLEPAPAPKK